jgi:predicted nucleotidyltransferase component of viral defense system
MTYHNVWGVDFTVQTMDIKEICAEKIRAMSDRARYRDFYDIFLLLEKYQLDLDEVVSYVRQKEIRRPITKANIQTNWKVIATEKEQEMSQIYYSKQVEDSQIETLIQSLPFDIITTS